VPRRADARLYSELAETADLLVSLGLTVRAAPMQQSDMTAVKEITAQMRHSESASIECFSGDPEDITALFSGAEIVVSMRLHALIFAACCGTAAAGIDLDPKINAFLKESGFVNLGTPDVFTSAGAEDKIRTLYASRHDIGRQAFEFTAPLKERAARDTDILSRLLYESL